MEAIDFYSPEITTNKIGYGLGNSPRATTTTIIGAINPLKAGVAVSAVWGGINAIINTVKYKQGRITGQDAVLDTAGESVGMGLAAGVGLLASNVVRASVLIASSSSLFPFVVGVVVTTGIKVIWDCNINRHLKCEVKEVRQQKEPAEATVVNL